METNQSLSPARGSLANDKRLRGFGLFVIALCLVFINPLLVLLRFAYETEMYSHILLIPVVSGYLIWQRRKEVFPPPASSPAMAAIPLVLGLLAVNAFFILSGRKALAADCDWLALTIFAWFCFLQAGALFLLGASFLRAFAFPAAFLIFMVPMPTFMLNGLEVFLQHASAEAAALLYAITGQTVFREGLVFRLPGLTIQVAQECSGVRSTFVLFITSLVAAQWFLRTTVARAILVLAVLPLAILRNAFRIAVISMLTVHVDSRIIDSPLHHRGGPIFFALSLVPFFALLWWLRRRENRHRPNQGVGVL
ncbi:MAG TPA: exosortase/archaeosortase family protein [Verrucomicrobiae bacterium]